jgi:hypothetical protein
VKDLPAQGLRSRLSPAAIKTQKLKPPHEVPGHGDGHEPVGVGLKLREGKAGESGLLQSLDVVFDVSVGSHGEVELNGVTLTVGVEAPIAKLVTGKEAALGTGVQGFSSHDAARAARHLSQCEVVGHLTDAGTFAQCATLGARGLPEVFASGYLVNGALQLGVGAR